MSRVINNDDGDSIIQRRQNTHRRVPEEKTALDRFTRTLKLKNKT